MVQNVLRFQHAKFENVHVALSLLNHFENCNTYIKCINNDIYGTSISFSPTKSVRNIFRCDRYLASDALDARKKACKSLRQVEVKTVPQTLKF